ncbi:L,D-transpeptidase family protein [Caldichromatium japonicum]|uniref:L,D-transpeptidase family protein n=1 Tax=Caldichromatium japonicum TaxID=2699430 RepID=A0A6G7VEC0_9GAMM|nr:L,D-transpeptidase family protein [Caldichromatium japonicum]QIK38235.1 L,D-transpeptidase family protein [Caldichromatium japonicum]
MRPSIPLVALLSWSIAGMPSSTLADELLASTLESFRAAPTLVLWETSLLSPPVLADFYAQRGYQFAWNEPARVAAFLGLVERSGEEGLRPEDFHIAVLRRLAQPGTLAGLQGSARLAADLLLSDALLRYVHHTRYGKLDPVLVDARWNDRDPVPEERLIADMQGALAAEDMAAFLAARFPKPFWYEDLKRALSMAIQMRELAELPQVPAGPMLAQGSRGERVRLVRQRLQRLGYQALSPENPEVFDAELSEAVRALQRDHGIKPDGAIGPQTLAVLNQPGDASRIDLIRLNLERMRWLYADLPADYILVDVAAYMAHLIRDGAIAWSTRVIVGKEDSQTPMFRDVLDHLVLNPTWMVPVSIQKNLGTLGSDYILVDRRTGQRVRGGNAADYQRYRVVQQPGPENALGRVKFMFPNRHAVYLHDTPSKALFGRSARALSHGCVRVQNPLKLAELLLKEANWNRARIDRVLEGTQTRHISLAQPLPVLLYYLTARADASGRVEIRPDIYGRDPAVSALLDQPARRIRVAFYKPVPLNPGIIPLPDPDSGVQLTRCTASPAVQGGEG